MFSWSQINIQLQLVLTVSPAQLMLVQLQSYTQAHSDSMYLIYKSVLIELIYSQVSMYDTRIYRICMCRFSFFSLVYILTFCPQMGIFIILGLFAISLIRIHVVL